MQTSAYDVLGGNTFPAIKGPSPVKVSAYILQQR